MPQCVPELSPKNRHHSPKGQRGLPPQGDSWHEKRIAETSPHALGPTIDTFTRNYQLTHQSRLSAYQYKRELQLLAGYYPEKQANDFSKLDLLDYTTVVRGHRAPQSVKRTITILRSFFFWCEDMELTDHNPARSLKPPKLSKPEPRFLTPQQVQQLFDAMESDILMQTYTALGCYAGLRRGSIHSLEWQDVDFDQGVLIVRNTKGGKNNIIPIAKELRRVLNVFRQVTRDSDCPLVIAHWYNGAWRPYSWTTAYRVLKNYIEKAGLPADTSAHDLRRTFATTLHQQGVDITVVSRLLGHADISTTMNHYAFTSDAQKEQAVATLSY